MQAPRVFPVEDSCCGQKIAAIGNSHPYESPAIDADDITEMVIETYQSRKTTLYIDNLLLSRTNTDLGTSEEPEVPEQPDVPVIPEPPAPDTPSDEYGGSIYDEDENGNHSSGNWS